MFLLVIVILLQNYMISVRCTPDKVIIISYLTIISRIAEAKVTIRAVIVNTMIIV